MSAKEQKATEYIQEKMFPHIANANTANDMAYFTRDDLKEAYTRGWDEAMEERKKDDIKDGIWIAVQFLVISHKEETLAKFLIKEAGLSKTDCYISQTLSDFQNEKMYEFINSIFKDK